MTSVYLTNDSSPDPLHINDSMAQNMTGAAGLLQRQLKYMQNAKDLPGISCGLVDNNVFEWEVMLMIADDCKYYGGKSHCYAQVPMGLAHL